ncbi:MAG: phosphoribosylformylglycinamidine synthase [Erysipelotrichaceae bacterium]
MKLRCFIQKKEGFDHESHALSHILQTQLDISASVRLLNGYDVEGLDPQWKSEAISRVFSEAMIDDVFELLPDTKGSVILREPLPGQYDQRADAAMQCLKLLDTENTSDVKTFEVALFDTILSADEEIRFIHYWVNPVEMRVKRLDQEIILDETETFEGEIEGFTKLDEEGIFTFLKAEKAAMSLDDLKLIQDHFKELHRNPTHTEFKVLDTYWSDHCRHTTFETHLTKISIDEGPYAEEINAALELFHDYRRQIGRETRPVTLMEIATIAGRVIDDPRIERCEEVNACSIKIKVSTDTGEEDWLLQFKNETHNHPTEIEPFGGASTCIGGAIRDPLSGRAYVYQAMRISGCGNVKEEIKDTMPDKLPQRVIAAKATRGNSSYGNQIGVATTHVKEIYHSRYAAKHFELGAVVGAVKQSSVTRQTPVPGDIIVLLGGRTGRDGIGGATGSSQAHTSQSLTTCASEVQKGNAPEERKIQRLFRKENVAKSIKKCNDFGAGGICVAIGELADGLVIDLDVVPLKYAGLNATELAISESQERMAVVLDPKDVQFFLNEAKSENLEATIVAKVTNEKRLVMKHRGQTVVDLDRALIDTNGVRQRAQAIVNQTIHAAQPFTEFDEESAYTKLASLSVASQKGLIEQFDASIGGTTVLFPLGGEEQLSPTQGSVQKISMEKGHTDTVSILTYGFIPELSEHNMFLSAQGAVLESIAKTIALGGKIEDIFFSFQEYFPRLNRDSKKWGSVVQALLGALSVQDAFKRPAIGGKDSMSGSFKDMDVLETLVSFACTPAHVASILSQEAKKAGNLLYFVPAKHTESGLFDLTSIRKTYLEVQEQVQQKKVASVRVVENGLFASVCVLVFGNNLKAKIDTLLDLHELRLASFLIETTSEKVPKSWIKIGEISDSTFSFNGIELDYMKAKQAYTNGLDFLYPVKEGGNPKFKEITNTDKACVKYKGPKIDQVRVVIPFFPGTNCETDTQRAFEQAGAVVNVHGIRNLDAQELEDSITEFCALLDTSQILALPGGFSAGDEPDGSAKFIVNVLRNANVKKSVEGLLKRDGLILGICNGFQALIKTGLLPYGEYRDLDEQDATLAHNAIHRHISAIANTRVTSNASPWLKNVLPGSTFKVPLSHGEGRIAVSEKQFDAWAKNGQVVLQYADSNGKATIDPAVNLNGSDYAIEGLVSPDGHILGKMGHTERVQIDLYKNIPGMKDLPIFQNGVDYFKNQEE